MTKDILDILASFETHHARSAVVMTRLVSQIKYVDGFITPVSMNGIKELVIDITEIMDGYKQDMLDVLEMHRAYIVMVDEVLKDKNDR